MNLNRPFSLIIACLVFVQLSPVMAAGKNHPTDEQLRRSEWPEGLSQLVNSRTWVQGHWINETDRFFYRGDAEELNAFLIRYASVRKTPLTVVLHAGVIPHTGPLGESQQERFNWMLLIEKRGWGAARDPRASEDASNFVATVHVWLSDAITLERLKIPEHVDVHSAYDVEQFILRHRSSSLSSGN